MEPELNVLSFRVSTGQFGYGHTLSTATEWDAWLVMVIPNVLDANVRSRRRSNLKHILVGVEKKAGLITPHATRGAGNASVLFEPYYTVMIFEFCVGAFSVCEGLGTAFRLRDVGNNGANAPHIARDHWIASLVGVADPNGNLDLEAKVRGIKSVRDKMHQDRLGARQEIDWRAFSYDDAFLPANRPFWRYCKLTPTTFQLPQISPLSFEGLADRSLKHTTSRRQRQPTIQRKLKNRWV